MTVTPKIDPRKDRTPKKRTAATQVAAYAAWAFFALGALAAAGSVFVWRDGRAPIAQAPIAPANPMPQVVVNPNSERELNRLNEAVRVLAAERDRLANRLEQLERSVGDITASIPQAKRAPTNQEPPPTPTAPEVQVAPPNPAPRPQAQGPNQIMPPQPQKQSPQVVMTPPVAPVAPEPPQQQAAAPDQSGTTRTEFGVDLGGEKSVDGLRARWATLRGNHGATLDGLRPVIAVHEGQ
jgi:hypothetical protein